MIMGPPDTDSDDDDDDDEGIQFGKRKSGAAEDDEGCSETQEILLKWTGSKEQRENAPSNVSTCTRWTKVVASVFWAIQTN